MEKKEVTFRIDPELYTQFKAYLTLDHTNVTAWINEQIQEYVNDKNDMLAALMSKKKK